MEAPRPPQVRQLWTAIHTGYACNNRCIFCAQGDLRAVPVVSPAPQQQRGNGPLVVFLGGEPTILEDLPSRVEREREAGARRVVVQTNGRRLAYRAYAAELHGAGVDALDISLQGPRAEIHDHHTRCPGSFAQTVAGARSALALGMEVGLTTVITRSNFRHLDELVRRAAKLGVRRLHMTPAWGLGEAFRLFPRVVPRLSLLAGHLEAAARTAAARDVELRVSGLPLCISTRAGCPQLATGTLPSPGAGEATWDGPRCQGCPERERCPGVDPTYLAHYGDEELDPLTGAALMAPGRDDLFAGLGWITPPDEPDGEAPGG